MGLWCIDCSTGNQNDFDKNKMICKRCNSSNIIEIPTGTNITIGDISAITKISKDKKFFESMIALKEKDPIEFQLKLTQFKATTVQQESATQQQNVPKCPTCGSTNIKKISAGSRWLSTGLFGISSSKMGKSMECRNCGYLW